MKTEEVTKQLIALDTDMSGDRDISEFDDRASKLLSEVVKHLSKSPDNSTRKLFNEATKRANVFIGVDEQAQGKLNEIEAPMSYAWLFCGKVARLRANLDRPSPVLDGIAHAIRQAATAKPAPKPRTAKDPSHLLDPVRDWIVTAWNSFAAHVAGLQSQLAMAAASESTGVSVDRLSKSLEHCWFKLQPVDRQCLKVWINPVGPMLGIDVYDTPTRRVLSHKLDGAQVRLEIPGLNEPVMVNIEQGCGMKKLPLRRLSGSLAEMRLSVRLSDTDEWQSLGPVFPSGAVRRRGDSKSKKAPKKKRGRSRGS